MDIAISRTKVPTTTRLVVGLLIILGLGFVLHYLWQIAQADISVDRDELVIAEVKHGDFTVSVRGAGILVPDNIQWLSASVEGVVAKRVVKAGNLVNKGDPIVVLDNPRLIQQLAEAEWEFAALEAELSAAQAVQESGLEEQKVEILNTRLDYENSVLEYSARAELMKTGAVSKLDYERSRLTMNQYQQRWLSAQQQLTTLEKTLDAQNAARAARLNKGRKSLEIIQQQVNNLEVKAGMDSIVLEMPLISGQRVMTGDSIAKLAQQHSLIAELQIPEIQIRQVVVGQRVIVDTRNNKITGRVSRIDPAVLNGSVLVDVTFTQELPDDVRPDLSVDGEIMISEIPDAFYVDRPLYAQSGSRTALFKLSDDGKFAERVEVNLGLGSVSQIQVIAGLQAGDRILVSDPTRFETYQRFNIH